MVRKWAARIRIPPRALTRGALPIVRDNYRINKFTSWRNAYNISTSAKWYRDTVVYHRGSYSPRPVTHCRAYVVVSRYPFGSYPPRCSMVRIVRHARSTPLKNRACLSGNCRGSRAARERERRTGPPAIIVAKRYSGGKSDSENIRRGEHSARFNYINISSPRCNLKIRSNIYRIMQNEALYITWINTSALHIKSLCPFFDIFKIIEKYWKITLRCFAVI